MLVAFGIGVGIMAAVDEIVFHQILAWHHFYDHSTPQVGLLSDGLLHAAEIVVIVAAFFTVADLRRRHILAPISAWAGFFLGLGSFQLFDGVVDHKLLRVHQVRYGVEDLLAYDIAWNLAGAVLLLIGAGLARRGRAEGAPAPATPELFALFAISDNSNSDRNTQTYNELFTSEHLGEWAICWNGLVDVHEDGGLEEVGPGGPSSSGPATPGERLENNKLQAPIAWRCPPPTGTATQEGP
ncbi:hypothetical protein GCM10023320_77710 [Pseudonocardia adelaidensis]|uniref:DUF2243 domain-containing protein n=2 Tax=Pseudonocardia adelaidensis TaxID=648754 RepID=A0ABP9P462_9PSEU